MICEDYDFCSLMYAGLKMSVNRIFVVRHPKTEAFKF